MSPFVASTSKVPSSLSSRIDISNVPPPRSYTAIFSFFHFPAPYASAAAVGSFTILFTSRPAIFQALIVACL